MKELMNHIIACDEAAKACGITGYQEEAVLARKILQILEKEPNELRVILEICTAHMLTNPHSSASRMIISRVMQKHRRSYQQLFQLMLDKEKE